MLLKEIKRVFQSELSPAYPRSEIDSFFYLLIEHYLNFERFILALEPNLNLTKLEEQPLFEALTQLQQHIPVQYIIGTAYFMELDFIVNKHVLIPRPETEELVRWIIEEVNTSTAEKLSKNADASQLSKSNDPAKEPTLKIIDIGTGSGCIAVSLAKYLANTKVFAIDISQDALKVARANALKHQSQIDFFQKDILLEDALSNAPLAQKYDVIVSNPPYVREQEKDKMQANVLDYEPGIALFVPDKHPLKYYNAIIELAKIHLAPGGWLYLEINQYLSEEMKKLFQKHNFINTQLRKDLFGNDRMMRGQLPE